MTTTPVIMTVPHSGTRYTVETFKACGYKTKQLTRQGRPEDGYDLYWGHMGHHKYSIGRIFKETENSIIVCRDPSMVWGTHASKTYNHHDDPEEHMRRFGSQYRQLRQAWQGQNLMEKHARVVHRVDKDDIAQLRDQGFPELKDVSAERYPSKTHPIKDALKARDSERLLELTEGTGAWQWFLDHPEYYADFYERHGYDLWWLD